MRALVKFGHKDGEVEIREMPEPSLPSDKVLLEVKAVGVCGSDIHLWHENQSWPIELPLTLGHEFSATVARVGDQVSGWKVGDRVTCETAAEVCGKCIYCLSGNYNLCPYRKGYGNQIDGALTRYVVARPQILHLLPGNVTFEQAALTEPFCVAYNALVEKTAAIKPGELVVIQGVGAIGMNALQIARVRGAGTLVALGTSIDEKRLQIARELGADYTINIQKHDPVAFVRSLGDGFGADLVVDATGVSKALQQAMEMVRPNGRITKIGWGPQPLNFNLDPLVAKAVTLQGTFSHTYPTWERVISLLSTGQLNTAPVIGGVYTLDHWQEAFLAMEHGQNIKSVIRMDGVS